MNKQLNSRVKTKVFHGSYNECKVRTLVRIKGFNITLIPLKLNIFLIAQRLKTQNIATVPLNSNV